MELFNEETYYTSLGLELGTLRPTLIYFFNTAGVLTLTLI